MSEIKLRLTIVFIVAYVVLANAGVVLSNQIGIEYLGETLLMLIFSFVLLLYAIKRKLTSTIGFAKINFADAKRCLFYIPLFILILANGVFFFDKSNNFQDIYLAIACKALLAPFLEELLFRGFLFKAIEDGQHTKKAVLISGATFGFGHIVNLMSGYTGIQQLIQIILAVAIGILLAVLLVRTKSIVPGIIFHMAFNTASVLSKQAEPLYDYIAVGFMLLVVLLYLVYLVNKGLSPERKK